MSCPTKTFPGPTVGRAGPALGQTAGDGDAGDFGDPGASAICSGHGRPPDPGVPETLAHFGALPGRYPTLSAAARDGRLA